MRMRKKGRDFTLLTWFMKCAKPRNRIFWICLHKGWQHSAVSFLLPYQCTRNIHDPYMYSQSLSLSLSLKNFNLFSVCLFENENWNEFLTNCKNVSRPRIFIFFFFFFFISPPSSPFFIFGGKEKKNQIRLAYLLGISFDIRETFFLINFAIQFIHIHSSLFLHVVPLWNSEFRSTN